VPYICAILIHIKPSKQCLNQQLPREPADDVDASDVNFYQFDYQMV